MSRPRAKANALVCYADFQVISAAPERDLFPGQFACPCAAIHVPSARPAPQTAAVGRRLQIASATVETHRRQIMDKLNLRTIAELTKYAVREGLSPLE